MNVMVSFGVMLAVMGMGVFLTYPNIAVVPLLAVIGSLAVVLPIVMYPLSYAMWLGVDIFMRDLEPSELADAAAAVATRTQ